MSDATTYPPGDHVLRDLEIASWVEAEGVAIGELPVTPVVTDREGAVSVGALVTLVDVACARATLAAVAPDWIATADLTVTSGARPRDGVVRAEARVVRAGSKLLHVDIDLGPVGVGAASFVRIPGSASRVTAVPAIGERTTMARTAPALDVPVTERMGLRVRDGAVELDAREYVSNSFRSLNGGVLGFVVVAAAEAATGRPAADVTLRYVGQTKVGPALATSRVVRTATDHAVVDVTVVDAGAGDLPLVRATVTTVGPASRR